MRHNIMRQPNEFSCAPTALAILMGWTFEETINKIGHDGSEIILPHHEHPPARRRSFVFQELLDAVYPQYGFISIEACPYIENEDLPIYNDPDSRLSNYMYQGIGLLEGCFAINRPHMVCWKGDKIIDPADGLTKSLDGFSIQYFHMLVYLRLAGVYNEKDRTYH